MNDERDEVLSLLIESGRYGLAKTLLTQEKSERFDAPPVREPLTINQMTLVNPVPEEPKPEPPVLQIVQEAERKPNSEIRAVAAVYLRRQNKYNRKPFSSKAVNPERLQEVLDQYYVPFEKSVQWARDMAKHFENRGGLRGSGASTAWLDIQLTKHVRAKTFLGALDGSISMDLLEDWERESLAPLIEWFSSLPLPVKGERVRTVISDELFANIMSAWKTFVSEDQAHGQAS